MHFTSASQSKVNDAAAITSESPITEVIKEATTTKATPEDVQGTLQDSSLYYRVFILPLVTFLIYFPPLFFTEVSTPLTEPHTSRRPRFLTPNRAKREDLKPCPRRVILYGIRSLKGANYYSNLIAKLLLNKKFGKYTYLLYAGIEMSPMSSSKHKAMIYEVSSSCLATTL